MIYEITWPGRQTDLPQPKLATKDCVVIGATFNMSWALNSHICFIKTTLENRGAVVVASSSLCTLEDYNEKCNG